ncbi:hypothetical protein M409DRAFT_50523 [Zasmidium cellare ATCC 36951]|uniref:J domain-containing protein n=1 Tax=Zasmidium cellare ATCC 36951 TaxID=1080233 RepID=A0A6A6D0G0_ZASCE|nr:uncharacterized protein M409DRAFT_50523 [Zasmidium cellare ATCC 36951]KAF2171908.1 hypothetical protein M409DRAFT_50523 [Zasmidium cellare ATCC 36951]
MHLLVAELHCSRPGAACVFRVPCSIDVSLTRMSYIFSPLHRANLTSLSTLSSLANQPYSQIVRERCRDLTNNPPTIPAQHGTHSNYSTWRWLQTKTRASTASPISKADRQAATIILERLPSRSQDPKTLRQDLKVLANLLLCNGYHREKLRPAGRPCRPQMRETVANWELIIREENLRASARAFHGRSSNARPKEEKRPGSEERKFKREDEEQNQSFTEPEDASETDYEDDDYPDFSSGARRNFSEHEDFLRREKERCEEARRQSQRERAEQKESKARAERERAKREQEEEAKHRQRAETPPQSQPRRTSTEDWDSSWATYRKRWNATEILARDANATLADLEKVFPWPLRNIQQLGLCKCKLDALFEKEVEAFFRHIVPQQQTAGVAVDDKKVILKALRKEAVNWHPDKVLVRFPVGAVPKALWELATKVTQVLTKLMVLFRG